MISKTRMEMSLKDYKSPLTGTPDSLTLSKIENPSYETYRDLHNKVGQPYGWEKRARINNVAAIKELLATIGVELWRFLDNQTLIGYALFTCGKDGAAELEDFGFFPQYCNLGYGNFFMSKILERMATVGVKQVWLTSRSTNHPKVISFYQKMGFQITSQIPIPENI